MALREGNRFFRPAVAQYTPQFVEEPSLFPEMLAMAERDQSKRDYATGQLDKLTEYLDVNAYPSLAHEKKRTELLTGYYNDINVIAKDLSEGAPPDQAIRKLSMIQRRWQTDPVRRELEASFEHGTAHDEYRREAGDEYAVWDDQTRIAKQQDEFAPIRFYGQEPAQNFGESVRSLFGKMSASGHIGNIVNYDDSGAVVKTTQGYEGISSDDVLEVAKSTANVWLADKAGESWMRKQLYYDPELRFLMEEDPDRGQQELYNRAVQFAYDANAEQIFKRTTDKTDLQYIPEYMYDRMNPNVRPIRNTNYLENAQAIQAPEMDVVYDASGMWQKPRLQEPGTDVDTSLDTGVKMVDGFMQKMSDFEKNMLGTKEDTRYEKAKQAAMRKYGKEWNEWMTAREFTEGIRRDYPSVENLSDRDVMNIYSEAVQKHSQVSNPILEIDDYDDRVEMKRLLFGKKEAKEMIESNDIYGRDVYMMDSFGQTFGGTWGEVVEELGYKWKDSKGRIKSGHKDEFAELLNDATVTAVGEHPNKPAGYYVSVRDSKGRNRQIFIAANETMQDYFRDTHRVYNLIQQGKDGEITSGDGSITYNVEFDLNPHSRSFDFQIIPRINRTGELGRPVGLGELMQASFASYELDYGKD